MHEPIQKLRIRQWVVNLLIVFSFTISCNVRATTMEFVPPITSWCDVLFSNWFYSLGVNICGYPTDLAAAQAGARVFNTIYHSNVAILSCDGKGGCLFTTTGQNSYSWTVGLSYDGCPVPTVNPGVPYWLNPTSLMCQRPAQNNFIITLSGSSTVEPSNGSTINTLPFIATVIDQNTGQPTANPVPVHISLTVAPTSGGHDHGDNARPRGGIAAVKTCPSDATCWSNSTINGAVVFNFNPTDASGTHTIIATCDGCSNTATANVDVKVPNLITIQSTPLLYSLIGAVAGKHSDNHYLTSTSIDAIWGIAADYHMDHTFWQPSGGGTKKLIPPPPLGLNDASLIWGGKFDLSGKWSGNHYEHGKGVAIDIRANGGVGAVPEGLFTSFVKLVAAQNAEAVLECTSNKVDGQGRTPPTCIGKDGSADNNRHFHVRIN